MGRLDIGRRAVRIQGLGATVTLGVHGVVVALISEYLSRIQRGVEGRPLPPSSGSRNALRWAGSRIFPMTNGWPYSTTCGRFFLPASTGGSG